MPVAFICKQSRYISRGMRMSGTKRTEEAGNINGYRGKANTAKNEDNRGKPRRSGDNQFVCMLMMQITNNHSLCPVARVAKKHVSLGSIDIDFHVLSNRIDQNIKLMPHTIETNWGDRSLPSLNRSVVKSVCNIVLV
jgi:hypothetical protein